MAGERIVAFEGMQHTFPADATDEEIAAALDQMHPAVGSAAVPTPNQADVRKAEPALSPMAAFNERSKLYENAMQRFVQETGGVLKPGQDIHQATAEYTGMQSPESGRAMAEIEELASGGELQYGNTPGYAGAKMLASIGGFAAGGPMGATGAESVVRSVSLASNLKKAIDAGAITEDRAAEILAKEMTSGLAEDAAWNFGLPLLGQFLKNIPGVRGLVAKVAQKIRPSGVAPDADLAAQRTVKVAKRVADMPTPAGKQAVEELSGRIGEHVLTPGQVTGKAPLTERVARVAGPERFMDQEKVVQEAGEALREATLAPAGQPTREKIGKTVQDLAEKAQEAMKLRLRPTFKEADNLGVKIDFDDVLMQAKAALAGDAAVPGGRLLPREKADLEQLVAGLEGTGQFGLARNSQLSAEAALDFISRQKEKIRAITADYKPSSFYESIVGRLTKSADAAFVAAAGKAGKPQVAAALKDAQGQYREMMETVYDDAVKQALRKNPEDVGRLFWQKGNVSEPKQMQELMRLAQREKTMTGAQAEDLNRAMTRGFLQEAVPNIDTAAQWTKMLREKPGLRDTWNTLTAAPGGKELRSAMDVLEQASIIASRGSAPVGGIGAVPIRRAQGLGLGVSYVTGTIHPGMLATGIAILPLTKMMATAYAQGNKGILNMVARALRAQSAGTAAGAKAAQAAYPVLEAYAAEHGITDLFAGDRPEGAASEPEPQ